MTYKQTLKKEIEYLKRENLLLRSRGTSDFMLILDLKKDKKILSEELDRLKRKYGK